MPQCIALSCFLLAVLSITACSPGGKEHNWMVHDNPDDEPIVFNTDGGWCWFQDKRAIIDNGTLLFGGVSSSGNITVTTYDFTSGETEVVVLHEKLQADDHNVPALMVRPDGRYLTAYTRHSSDNYMRYRISEEPGNASKWVPEQLVDVGGQACYSNLHRLEDEGLTYNFHRGRDWDPNYMISDDDGDSWTYGGKLWEFPDRPYPRYASNGRDQIHVITTEAHPRDYTNSIYHGYISKGTIYKTDGSQAGKLSTGTESAIRPTDLTLIFQGDEDNVAWTSSIELDDDGHPYIGYSVTKDRVEQGSGGFDHRYRYARWDGSQWNDHEIAYAGTRLYTNEDEYTGLITLNPVNPDMVYISTDAHPVSGEPLISEANGERHYEIFQGITEDMGATWNWEPVTENSQTDNIRPVILADESYQAVLWLRGDYRSYTDYNLEVVGFVSGTDEG
ncbi:MAG: BNR-4 repeat-containing protein [Balneolales bacterium]